MIVIRRGLTKVARDMLHPLFKSLAAGATALLCLAASLHGQEIPIAFVGAKIIPIAGEPIANGVVVVQRGKIVSIGGRDTKIPEGAVTREVSGKVILPGLVDTHSHIGAVALADSSTPIQPDIRVIDSIDVRDASIRKARAGGITTANVMPGSGLLVGGQTLYLKLRDGDTIDGLLMTNKTGRVAGGLKMANGTNSRRDPPFPGT